MAATDYEFPTPQATQGLAFDTNNDMLWNFVRDTVDSLEAMVEAPWVCRGSSINPGVETVSTTPDGQNRWTGLARTSAMGAGNNVIWLVLENTVSGHQVCFRMGLASSVIRVEVTYAKNKFEAGGVWKGGGVDAQTRPEDVISTDPAEREVAVAGVYTTAVSAAGIQCLRTVANRKDGRGFYAWFWPFNSTDTKYSHALGVFPQAVVPDGADPNPVVTFSMNGGALFGNLQHDATPTASPSTLLRFSGMRAPTGTVANYAELAYQESTESDIGGGSLMNTADPWTGKFPIVPMALWTDLNQPNIRSAPPDFYRCQLGQGAGSGYNGADPWGVTLNLEGPKSHTRVGTHVLPWDGATALDVADEPVFNIMDVPGGGEVSKDVRRFNRGHDTP